MVYYQFNNDNAVSIRAQVSGSTYHYPNKTPNDIYTAYNSVSSRKNDGYNTIVMTKYADGEYYGYVYGIHLPTDKIIDIDTETHDYIAFHWDNMTGTGSVNDDWGSNCLYAHQARINSDDTNFSLNGTVYNQYGGSGHYTVDGKYWIYTSWWGFSENTPIQIYTTVSLDNIRVDGQPLVPTTPITSNGGGATHIAKVTGQLSTLSSNLSDILIVSGGGGGGMLVGETGYEGADAGGISGSGDNSADQSTGYAFGQGESGSDVSGGGGGLYGGYKGVVT